MYNELINEIRNSSYNENMLFSLMILSGLNLILKKMALI